MMPGHVRAKLGLGVVLVEAGRPRDAEAPLRRGIGEVMDANLKAQFYLQLSLALRRQRKDSEALAACDSAQALAPALPEIALHRIDALQNLDRNDEALTLLRGLMARSP